MARLTRVHQKVFASNASNNGVFGSLQAGNPTTSNDVATLQSLSAFENGWDDAIEQGDKLPPLEEFQGLQYGISYQQAYMLQEGIAEWNANTPYYKGSLTKAISGTSFKLYCSLQDNNTNHVVTNTTYWKKVMDSDDLYAYDSAVVHNTGNESISGTKAFSSTISGSITGNAGTVTNGVYTNTNQTITGNKTFSGSNTFSGSVALNGTISGGNSVKETIVGWGMPDYSSGTTLSTGVNYTAGTNGILYLHIYRGNSGSGSINVVIDSESFNYASNNYTDVYNIMPIKKGSLYEIVNNGGLTTIELYFYPCVGG